MLEPLSAHLLTFERGKSEGTVLCERAQEIRKKFACIVEFCGAGDASATRRHLMIG